MTLFCWTIGLVVLESAGEAVQDDNTSFVTYAKDAFLLGMR